MKVAEDELVELNKRVEVAVTYFPELRYGQAVFNEAYSMFPEEVEKIRGTDDDCFYDNKKVSSFLSHFELESSSLINYER